MSKVLKRLAASIMIAAILFGTVLATPVEAASLHKPGNCRFVRWLNTSFTSCRLTWNKVSGANAYAVEVALPNGTYKKTFLIRHRYIDLINLSNTQVYRFRVRACRVNSSNKVIKTGAFSNMSFITPLPKNVYGSLPNKSKKYVKLTWNRIYNSSGYNLFLTTNPNGKWFWNQTTAARSTATSATIKKYRGNSMKYYQNYYVRIVPRLKINGTYRNVPVPSSSYYSGGFYIKKIYY